MARYKRFLLFTSTHVANFHVRRQTSNGYPEGRVARLPQIKRERNRPVTLPITAYPPTQWHHPSAPTQRLDGNDPPPPVSANVGNERPSERRTVLVSLPRHVLDMDTIQIHFMRILGTTLDVGLRTTSTLNHTLYLYLDDLKGVTNPNPNLCPVYLFLEPNQAWRGVAWRGVGRRII